MNVFASLPTDNDRFRDASADVGADVDTPPIAFPKPRPETQPDRNCY